MRRMSFLLLLACLALPAAAADKLDGFLTLVRDDATALAKAAVAPGRHVMMYFGDYANWSACRYTVSVLSSPEVSARYSKNYVSAHVDFGELAATDPRQDMVERHNSSQLRPMLVFLDVRGKEVARIPGLKSKDDALLLDRFISEKHYLKGNFASFKAAQKS